MVGEIREFTYISRIKCPNIYFNKMKKSSARYQLTGVNGEQAMYP